MDLQKIVNRLGACVEDVGRALQAEDPKTVKIRTAELGDAVRDELSKATEGAIDHEKIGQAVGVHLEKACRAVEATIPKSREIRAAGQHPRSAGQLAPDAPASQMESNCPSDS